MSWYTINIVVFESADKTMSIYGESYSSACSIKVLKCTKQFTLWKILVGAVYVMLPAED